MGRPRSRQPAPPGYVEIEAALIGLATGRGRLALLRALDGVDHRAARDAMAMAQAGDMRAAEKTLELALLTLAGPANGAGLAWFAGYA